MANQSPSFLTSISDFFRSLFGAPPPPPKPPPDLENPVITPEPLTPLTPRVLVLTFDPVIDQVRNTGLIEWGRKNRGWKPIEELLAGYISDIEECSGGLLKYNIVEQKVIREFPLKADGFRYNAIEFLDMYTNRINDYHKPDAIDYYKVIQDHNLQARVDNGEIDEVWIMGPPFAGLYESIMCGTGAFWCNAPPLANTKGRRYVIMGFSYERGVGEMLEDLGHRTESIMAHMYNALPFVGYTFGFRQNPTQFDAVKYAQTNLLAKFLLHDRIAPGNAQVGNLHYAPNSDRDYDWGNPRTVPTYADDWLTFPNLPRAQKMQNASSWGNGDIREHHRWWFHRVPKAEGRMNGIRMNWWAYLGDVTNVELDSPTI